MKNFMPSLSEKSTDSFTFARWPHQHRSALTPGGKLASFDFFGRKSGSEQGTLMVEFHGRGGGRKRCIVMEKCRVGREAAEKRRRGVGRKKKEIRRRRAKKRGGEEEEGQLGGNLAPIGLP